MKIKSHPKLNVDFESNSKSVKSNKRFYSKKYQSENHRNNQQKCINCFKPKSNTNGSECENVIATTAHFVMYKNGSVVKN